MKRHFLFNDGRTIEDPSGTWCYIHDALAEIAAARREEREEIIEELRSNDLRKGCKPIVLFGLDVAIERIKARGEPPESKPLDRMGQSSTWPELCRAFNNMAARLEALEGRK